MRYFITGFLLFVTLFTDCARKSDKDNTENANKAKYFFQAALAAERNGDYWQSIKDYDVAISLYESEKEADYYLYLAHRFKAKMLNEVQVHTEAVKVINKALTYLRKATLPSSKSAQAEYLSTLRYKASYLREAGAYGASNELLFTLLKQNEIVPNMHAHIRNLIGLNFIALGDMQAAHTEFDEILKIEDLENDLKAHYLNNRSYAAFRLNKAKVALADIDSAIALTDQQEDKHFGMLFRIYKGEYELEQGELTAAKETLLNALNINPQVESRPEFFKVYNLLFAVALATGDPAANDYKSKYDQLQHAHQREANAYTQAQELALMHAQLDSLRYEKQRKGWSRTIAGYKGLLAVVIFSLLIAGAAVIASISRSKRIQQVLE